MHQILMVVFRMASKGMGIINMVDILQTTFSNALCCVEMLKYIMYTNLSCRYLFQQCRARFDDWHLLSKNVIENIVLKSTRYLWKSKGVICLSINSTTWYFRSIRHIDSHVCVISWHSLLQWNAVGVYAVLKYMSNTLKIVTVDVKGYHSYYPPLSVFLAPHRGICVHGLFKIHFHLFGFRLSNRSEIWQAPRQQRCRDAYQIS